MDNIKRLEQAFHLSDLEAMDGDVSSRKYFRSKSGVVMLDDEEGGDQRRRKFIDIAGRLKRAGLKVPEIYAHEPKLGAIFLEDFGQEDLFHNPDDKHYEMALHTFLKLQNVEAEGLTIYSAEIYEEELSRLMRFYLEPRGVHDRTLLDIARPYFEELEAEAKVFVHVDFHAQNLMIVDQDIGLIDFQDARKGHRLYDLVSLVDDVRLEVPKARAEKLISHSFAQNHIKDAELWFHVLSVQRLLKIIGIFARQANLGRTKYDLLLPRCFRLLKNRLEFPALHDWKCWVDDVMPQYLGDPDA